jgi:hypothetical protein
MAISMVGPPFFGGRPGRNGHSMVGQGTPLPIVLEEALGQMAIPGLEEATPLVVWEEALGKMAIPGLGRPGPRPLFSRKPWAIWPFQGWTGHAPGHCFGGSPGQHGHSRVGQARAPAIVFEEALGQMGHSRAGQARAPAIVFEEALGQMAILGLGRPGPRPLFSRKPWAKWPFQA